MSLISLMSLLLKVREQVPSATAILATKAREGCLYARLAERAVRAPAPPSPLTGQGPRPPLPRLRASTMAVKRRTLCPLQALKLRHPQGLRVALSTECPQPPASSSLSAAHPHLVEYCSGRGGNGDIISPEISPVWARMGPVSEAHFG
jgi:hypothetical protein